MTAQATPRSVRVRPYRDVTAETHLRPAGVLFFLLGVAFITVTMLAASMAPAYDFNGAAISDLGVIDQTALLFNTLLVVMGVLNLSGGFLYYRRHGRAWLLALYVMASVGTVGAGLFPLSSGGLHSIFAVIAFVSYNLEGLGTATVLTGPMRVLGLAAGVIGLLYTVLMVLGDSGDPALFGPIGHGGTERMIAYPVTLWLIALGGYLMAGSSDAAGRGRGTKRTDDQAVRQALP